METQTVVPHVSHCTDQMITALLAVPPATNLTGTPATPNYSNDITLAGPPPRLPSRHLHSPEVEL